MKCEHRRRRKIYSHGKKSKPTIVCKDCGEIVSKNQLAKEREKRKKLRRRLNEQKKSI